MAFILPLPTPVLLADIASESKHSFPLSQKGLILQSAPVCLVCVFLLSETYLSSLCSAITRQLIDSFFLLCLDQSRRKDCVKFSLLKLHIDCTRLKNKCGPVLFGGCVGC